MLADLFEVVGSNRLLRLRLALQRDRRRLRLLGFVRRDVVLLGHALQDVVAPPGCRGHVDVRTLARGRLDDAGDERGFLQRHVLCALVEIQARRGLDAVGAVAEVNLVAVEREDFALRVPLLDLNGEQRLLHLAVDALLETDRKEVARELLRERAGARGVAEAMLEHVPEQGDEDARDAEAEMRVEVGVLGRNDRFAQLRGDVLVADDQPALHGELADHAAVRGVDARNRARIVVVERGDFRQVSREREEDTAQDSESRRHGKQRDDGGAAGDANDVIGHGQVQIRLQASGFGLRAMGVGPGLTPGPHTRCPSVPRRRRRATTGEWPVRAESLPDGRARRPDRKARSASLLGTSER